MFTRYKQVKYLINVKLARAMEDSKACDYEVVRKLNQANFASYFITIVGSLGLVMPANFRTNEWIWPHGVGALIAFLSICICNWYMVSTD